MECIFTKLQVVALRKADHLQEDETSDSSRTPLISIGLVILIVLMVPMLLYSVSPEGPLKVGDVVFATDRHRVKFVDPNPPQTQGYQDFCILESRVQLVVQKLDPMSGSSMVAQPIGVQKIDVRGGIHSTVIST